MLSHRTMHRDPRARTKHEQEKRFNEAHCGPLARAVERFGRLMTGAPR